MSDEIVTMCAYSIPAVVWALGEAHFDKVQDTVLKLSEFHDVCHVLLAAAAAAAAAAVFALLAGAGEERAAQCISPPPEDVGEENNRAHLNACVVLLFAVSLVLGLRVLQWGVRGTLAACIHDIARIIGRELTEKHLKDIYRRLMDDWFQVCNRGSSRKGESQ